MSDEQSRARQGRVDRAAMYWGARHRDLAADAEDEFLIHPLVQTYVSLRAFGQNVGHLDVAAAELRGRTRPGDRVLSVGCGPAVKERALARLVPDRHFVAFDIAAETVERVRASLAAEGPSNLEVQVADFNALDLEPGSFRAILGLGAIHHVERLEEFWAACARGLSADGALLAQEYVGPSRFQWTDAQIEAGDRALRELIPARYRTHHHRIQRPSIDSMIAIDPSEAVRSAEILATCEQAGFRIDGYAGAGCALLYPVLMHQIAAFDPRNWEDNYVLAALFREESRLMERGELGDDYAMFIARPPT